MHTWTDDELEGLVGIGEWSRESARTWWETRGADILTEIHREQRSPAGVARGARSSS